MLIKSEGIILRSVKYSESSLILDIFTKEIGLATYIISGVRKTKSKSTAANLQVGSILELILYNNDNLKINRVKEAKSLILFNRLFFEIKRFSVALFLLELLRKSIREREKNGELYDLIIKSIIFLDNSDSNLSNFHLVFLCRMAAIIGFGPENNFNDVNSIFDLRDGKFIDQIPYHKDYLKKNESIYLSKILSLGIENSHELKIKREEKMKILNNLILYYEIHIGNIGKIKTLEVFQNIF